MAAGFSLVANAQETTKSVTKPAKSVIKFLGIPVDGYPYSMRQKLIEKGFKFIPGSDKDDPRVGGELTGIFNNEKVDISILKNPHTGKVWRINVWNQNGYSKDEAITKFNNLVRQFDAKGNYTRRKYSGDTYYISLYEDDVDFDGNVYKKQYLAAYYQGYSKMKKVWFMISKDKNSDKYYIAIYYENLYNEPKDGEDL